MQNIQKQLSPGKHSIAAFTFVILLPLVYYIPPWLAHYISGNHLVVTVLAVAIIVPIVSYIALPVFNSIYTRYNICS